MHWYYKVYKDTLNKAFNHSISYIYILTRHTYGHRFAFNFNFPLPRKNELSSKKFHFPVFHIVIKHTYDNIYLTCLFQSCVFQRWSISYTTWMKRKETFVCLLKVVKAQRYCLGRNTTVECPISPIIWKCIYIRVCSKSGANVEVILPYEYSLQIWNGS